MQECGLAAVGVKRSQQIGNQRAHGTAYPISIYRHVNDKKVYICRLFVHLFGSRGGELDGLARGQRTGRRIFSRSGPSALVVFSTHPFQVPNCIDKRELPGVEV